MFLFVVSPIMHQSFTKLDISHKNILLQTQLFLFPVTANSSSQLSLERALEKTTASITKLMKTCDKIFLLSEYPDEKLQELLSVLQKNFSASPSVKQVMYVANQELHEKEIPNGTLVLLDTASQFFSYANKKQNVSSLFNVWLIDSLEILYNQEPTVGKIFSSLEFALGPACQTEKDELEKVLYHGEHPSLFIGAGDDVDTVLKLSQPLLKRTDQFLFAGKASHTFLYSRLISVGNSPVEKDFLSLCFQLVDKISYLNKEFLLPVDHIVTEKVDAKMKTKVHKKEIGKGFIGLDIGPKTISAFKEKIKKANTIIWYGDLSAFQNQAGAAKSNSEVIKAITKSHAYKVVVGAEAITIAQKENVLEEFNLVLADEKILINFLPQNFSVAESN